jgi:hypothetical protein
MTCSRRPIPWSLIVVATFSVGCATVNCDTEAREAAPAGDENAIAKARTQCDKRLSDARRHLKKQEEERRAEERRDEFRHRKERDRR